MESISYDNRIDLSDVEQVMLTGVGAHYIDKTRLWAPRRQKLMSFADGLGAQ